MSYEIYGAAWCGVCTQAKKFLTERGLEFKYKDFDRPEVKEELRQRYPQTRSIPQIFLGEQHIGGFDDLKRMFAED